MQVTGELHDHLTCFGDALRAALHCRELSVEHQRCQGVAHTSGGLGGVSFTRVTWTLHRLLGPWYSQPGTQYNTMYSYKDARLRREWIAYLQAGALGIVADNVLDDEHSECRTKAAGLARAIDLASPLLLTAMRFSNEIQM
ncbi:hypothetical protein OIU77_019539 [Salix suchowensis]|uniref:Uncharacterized protein n=1 Tax=Salix suchowensis TaxID=1278906 RepID=A0ABQ9CKL8_9ROSI|nr:hypothetical protein OIU77_019539 [Salix suchowensis]